jgi:hypothetical protein
MGQIPAHIQYQNQVATLRRRSRASMSASTLISIGVAIGLSSFVMVLVVGLAR